MGVTKTIQDLKTEFNKEIKVLWKTQDEMKMKMKNPIIQFENLNKRLTGRMNQAEVRKIGFEDNAVKLDGISKEYKTKQRTELNEIGLCRLMYLNA